MKKNVSKLLVLMIIAAMILTACAGEAAPAPAPAAEPAPVATPAPAPAVADEFAPGTFLGVGSGLYGPIVVELTMSAVDQIDAIRVVAHDETHNTGNVPLELYPSLIVENQSLQVDIVAGATISSFGFLAAVRDALNTAGSDPAQFTGEARAYVPHADTSADIVVIGSGGAGLTAAIHAAYEGHNVIVLEKLGIIGGTTNYVLEGFGSVGSRTHIALGSGITPEMLTETLITNNPNGDPEAFELLAHNNGWAADWLRSIGAMMTVAGGQAAVATSREIGPIGETIVSALQQEAIAEGVDIRINSRAVEILMDGDAVSGVRVSTPFGEYTIAAEAVILASGGFASNPEMVTEHFPALQGFRSAASPGNTGDGHLMAEAVGAELLNMDHVRMNYTYTITDDGFSIYVATLVNTGGIVINDSGERFMNDQIGHGGGRVALEQGGEVWGVFDNTIRDGVQQMRRIGDQGHFLTADTLEELADLMGIDRAAFMATIERYQEFVANGQDEDFNRPMVNMTFTKGPFHALRLTVHTQGTFGGVSTNVAGEVLTAAGDVIPGLFAVGEVANDGTWGANPVAVNTVFGRVAGQSAAAYVDAR